MAHALEVRRAIQLGNYHRFFKLYLRTPNMGMSTICILIIYYIITYYYMYINNTLLYIYYYILL